MSRTSHVRIVGVTAILVLAVTLACQTATTSPSTPSRPALVIQRPYPTPDHRLNLPGQFVFAPGDGSLWLESADGRNARPLIKQSQDTYAVSPAFSPDGKHVAYSVQASTNQGDWLRDIRVIGVNDAQERVVTAPQDVTLSYSYPAWSADGRDILFTQSYPVSQSNTHTEIDRVSAKGSGLHKVIEDGLSPSVSPDGNMIAFLRFDAATYRSSLWVAQSDGSHPTQLLDKSVFVSIQSARFSPDSQYIVFAASGAPQGNLPGLQSRNSIPLSTQPARTDSCLATLFFTCWLQTASAHGLPWDIWLAKADGARFDRLTQIGADSPYPAWSPDGKYIAFMDYGGIYVVNRGTKEGYLISPNGGHGALDWH